MSFESDDFEIIGSKDIEGDHELLKIRLRENGNTALILAKKGTKSGALFGGHNWEDMAAYPDMVDEFYEEISSIRQFVQTSFQVRAKIQALIEAGS